MARTTLRTLLVIFVAIALLSCLPMYSEDAEAARIINSFDDGRTSKIIAFTTPPAQGERQTVYLSLKADDTVVSASLNVTGLAFGRRDVFVGGSFLGYRMDLSGDVDNDGYHDYIAAAPNNANLAGNIFVLRGSATGVTAPANATITGAAASDRIGWGLASGGDINNDGYHDIVGGAIQVNGAGAGTGSGKASIIWGGPSPINTTHAVTLSQGSNGDCFGWSVTNHGDLNKDGYDDVVVGAPGVVNVNTPGRVYVFLGGPNGPGTTPNVTLAGSTNGDLFGFSVHICGDVNGDGYDELLVGAPGFNGSTAPDWDLGKVFVYFGNDNGINTSADWTFEGENTGDNMGQNARGAGDIDNDGYDDIIAGSPFADTSVTDGGITYVWHGHKGGPNSTADAKLSGSTADGFLGWDLAGVGDANGDGYDDIAVGDPQTANGTTAGAGTVHIYMGTSSGISKNPAVSIKGSRQFGFLGAALGPGGDADADGFSDVAHGTRYEQRTYVEYGDPGPKDIKLFLDNTEILSISGHWVGPKAVLDFGALLNTYILDHQAEQDPNGNITVPINITFANKARVRLDNVRIIFYKLRTPTGLEAQSLPVGNSVKLTWDPHTGDDISKMAIEYWNGTGWEEITKVPKHNTSHVITGLEDGVDYRFRLRAYDGDVQRYGAPSGEANATAMDLKAPDRVMNVRTEEDREVMGINVSWDPSDPDVTNYEVWTNKTGSWFLEKLVMGNRTWWVDTNITDGPKYYYRVRAWDEALNVGDFSAIKSGRLRDLDPPAVPSNVEITQVDTGNALIITWDPNDDDTVEYSLTSNKTGTWKEIVSLRGVTTYKDTGLSDGVRYYYRVAALDESDNPSAYTKAVYGVPHDIVPPASPEGLEAAARPQGNTLRLTWAEPTDDTVRFNVYIFNESSGEWEMVGFTSDTVQQYDIGNLEDGKTYRFRLKAVDDAGLESDWSAGAQGTPTDTLFPGIVTGLDIDLDPRGGRLNISWSANTDDTVEYIVLRWDVDARDYVEVARVPADVTWFEDTGLENNQPYAYVVRSVDEAGNVSPNSARIEDIPEDTVPPEAPTFTDLPVFTNKRSMTVHGECEPGVIITLHVNMLKQEPETCDDQGRFSVEVTLKAGPNEIYALAEDTSEIDTESAKFIVTVDLQGPQVEVTTPTPGTSNVERENMTFEVYFTEDVSKDSLRAFLREGRHNDVSALYMMRFDPDTIHADLLSYSSPRALATFVVNERLKAGTTYTILVYDVEDLAGNKLSHDDEGYAFHFETVGGGDGGGGGGGTSDGGLGSLGIIIAAVVVVLLVVIIAVFLVVRSRGEGGIRVDRTVVEPAPSGPEEAMAPPPDEQTLYGEAYHERDEEPSGRTEVEGGLGEWLAEQERASQEAEEETQRLMQELAESGPPTEDEGPIEEVPPGMLPETHAAEELEGGPEEERDEEPDEEPEEEPDEGTADASEEVDEEDAEEDLEGLLDELEDEAGAKEE